MTNFPLFLNCYRIFSLKKNWVKILKASHLIAFASSTPSAYGEVQFTYDSSNKLDPFKVTLVQTFLNTQSGPLQKVDVHQLRLSGVILGEDILAILNLPDGTGHFVRIGDMVGSRGGRVLTISRTKLVVREPTSDQTGQESLQKYVDKVLELAVSKGYTSTSSVTVKNGSPTANLPFTLFPRLDDVNKGNVYQAIPQISATPPPEDTQEEDSNSGESGSSRRSNRRGTNQSIPNPGLSAPYPLGGSINPGLLTPRQNSKYPEPNQSTGPNR